MRTPKADPSSNTTTTTTMNGVIEALHVYDERKWVLCLSYIYHYLFANTC